MSACRVTFLMLTYNQAGLVREAMRGALAQDYPNLQLLVSDDHSPDDTFAELQAVAASYRGPHSITVRRTPSNIGLVPHLYDAAGLANGDLIVVAAGDDLSYPNRVSSLVQAWQESGADALCSRWDVIDESGQVVEQGGSIPRADVRLPRYFPDRQVTPIIGATAAYTPDVFRNVPCPGPSVFAEDLFFTLMLHWRGRKVVEVPEALIGYRRHDAAITHQRSETLSILEQEQRGAREAGRLAELLALVDELTEGGPPADSWGDAAAIDRAALRSDIRFNAARHRWNSAGVLQRLRDLAASRDPEHRRWMLPRLLGPRVLAGLKTLRH